MRTKRYVLTFPPEEVESPVIYHLVKEFDIKPNILRASINPQEQGTMVLELNGRKENLDKALEYLKGLGVIIEGLGQDIAMNETRCIQCGACTGFCPTGALDYERPAMKVVFNEDKCIACELCLTACLTRAMEGRLRS
jgi:L-aspartate semialdehyde sulfurtransferase ferredoxin